MTTVISCNSPGGYGQWPARGKSDSVTNFEPKKLKRLMG